MAYKSLNSAAGEIRLLHLLPSADTEQDIICDLVHQNVNDKVSYSALSYVWGNPKPEKTITLGNKKTYVTPNLFAALRRLRRATETIHLWVDALCINQGDVQERSSQVEIMWKIYEKAEVVLMWLGEEENNSNLALELVQHLGAAVSDGDRIVSHEDEPHRLDRLKDLLSNTSYNDHWQALRHLFKRLYWSRVWIVQEVMFASKATLCCGAMQANWRTLSLLLYLQAESSFSYLSPDAKDMVLDQTSLPITLATMHTKRMVGQDMSLLDGLVFYRNRLATDPRDHIYAILNLVDRSGFKPDYSKSLFTLYREVVIRMIEQHDNLDILSACRRAHRRTFNLHTALLSTIETLTDGLEEAMSEGSKVQSLEEIEIQSGTTDKDPSSHSIGLRDSHFESEQHTEGIEKLANIHVSWRDKYLPSWVPDWRDMVPESGYLLLNSSNCYYKASGTTQPKVWFPKNQQVLIASGIRVDTIKAVSAKMANSDNNAGLAIKAGWDLWQSGDHIHRYEDLKEQQDAYRQTIVLGRNIDGSKGDRHLSTHNLRSGFGLDFAGEQEDEESLTEREYLSIWLMNPWLGFCVTNHGFMGRVPHGTEPGDVVVILFGAKVPFVLRKHRSEGKYFFVGDCYIHGIMEGEIVNEMKESDSQMTDFHLL